MAQKFYCFANFIERLKFEIKKYYDRLENIWKLVKHVKYADEILFRLQVFMD